MIDPISAHEFAIRGQLLDGPGLTGGASESKKGVNFSETLADIVKQTNDLQKSADQTLEDFSTGKVEDMHQVMLSMNRADLSFQMLLEVRNKLIEAYTEIMRTQV